MMKLIRKQVREKVIFEEVEEEVDVRFEMKDNTLRAYFEGSSQILLKITPEGIQLATWVSPALPLPRQGDNPAGPIKILEAGLL